MFLFIAIPVLCVLLSLGSEISKALHLSKLYGSNSGSPTREQEEELRQAKENLERVRSNPASGEYAQFVKTMRAEQKVNDLESSIRTARNMGRLKSNSVDIIAGYVLKAALSLTLGTISLRNRYTPVMVYDESINLAPLTGLLSFPTGVANAVSVPMWVLACNITISFVSNIIKKKL